ncbi:MAG: hypothetical protein ACK5EJ_05100, partial [Sphingomonadaceae bacterium]
ISSAPQPVTRTAAAVAYTIPRNLGSNILILRNKYGLPDYRQMQRTSDESTQAPPVDAFAVTGHL